MAVIDQCCQEVAWGLLWAVLAVLGQLAIGQPAPARLPINQGLSFAAVGMVPGPPWEQRAAVLSCGICRLK